MANTPEIKAHATPLKRIKIKIASDPNDPIGSQDVTVGWNGDFISIKRDVPVMVKPGHLSVLQNAVQTSYIIGKDGEVTGQRETPRYNIQVLG